MKNKFIFTFITLTFLAVTSVSATPNGQPFNEIWNAIEEIQDAINDIWDAIGQQQCDDCGLTAVSNTVALSPGTNANMVMMCPQDTHIVGGSCWYDKDPATNGTAIVHDGVWYGNESWNCYVLNGTGIDTISVRTSSICKDD